MILVLQCVAVYIFIKYNSPLGSAPIYMKDGITSTFRLKLRTHHSELFYSQAFWGWPNLNEFPLGYPIASFLDRTEGDSY